MNNSDYGKRLFMFRVERPGVGERKSKRLVPKMQSWIILPNHQILEKLYSSSSIWDIYYLEVRGLKGTTNPQSQIYFLIYPDKHALMNRNKLANNFHIKSKWILLLEVFNYQFNR